MPSLSSQRRSSPRQPMSARALDKRFWDYSVYAYNFTGDVPRNLAKKSHGKRLTKGTALFKAVGNGAGLFSTTDASTRAYGDSSVTDPIITSDGAGTGDFCIAFSIKPVAGSTRRVLFHQFNNGGGNQLYIVANGYLSQGTGTFVNESGTLWVGVYDSNSGAWGRGAYKAGLVDGSELHGVFNRLASGKNELWISGSLVAEHTGAVADCYGNTATQLGINGRADQTGYSSNVSCVRGIYGANRRLTPAESARISRNHWDLYRRRRDHDFVGIDLAAGATLEAHAQAEATATGNLTLAATLDGLALAVASASGNLTTEIPLAGAAVSVVSATGDLLTGIKLSAAAVAQATAAGNLTAQIRLDGAALAQAAASAGLTSAILLAGSAQGQAGASGTLSGETSGLAGDAHAQASAVATLTTSIRLSGTAAAQAGVSGILTTAIPLTAAALATAIATATLSVPILLAGHAQGQASASGILSDATEPPPAVYYRLTASVQRVAQLACSDTHAARLSAAARPLTTLTHQVSHV